MQTQAALTQAEINLDYTDIRAPIDGRIGRTAYTVGNLVNPASGVLATIVSQDPIYVLFPVSVRELETIREARRKEGGGLTKIEIRVRLSNGQDYPHPGVWNFTDPQVDQQTDTLIMRATIPNPERHADRRPVRDRHRSASARRSRAWWSRRRRCRSTSPATTCWSSTIEHKVEQRRVQTGPNLGTDVVVDLGPAAKARR